MRITLPLLLNFAGRSGPYTLRFKDSIVAVVRKSQLANVSPPADLT
jgi:hypothetical protein